MRTTAIHTKRPVNTAAILIATLIGFLNHLAKPLFSLNQHIKRANCAGRISYHENRIAALQSRLNTIENTLHHEAMLPSPDKEFIKNLAAMKASAVEELADEKVALFNAQQGSQL